MATGNCALAAYNWGEGNVQRAMQRKRDRNAPSVYESLRGMPAETRDYVPKLQAVKNIVAKPEAFGLSLPPLENHPYFLSVAIERDLDVELAAKLAGIGLEEFQQLNPQMNRPVILAAGTPQVLLPYDAANAFVRNLPLYDGPLATWTVWVAPKTLKPAEAARDSGHERGWSCATSTAYHPRCSYKPDPRWWCLARNRRWSTCPGIWRTTGTWRWLPDTRGFRRVTFRAPASRRQRRRGRASLQRASRACGDVEPRRRGRLFPRRAKHRRDGGGQTGVDPQGRRFGQQAGKPRRQTLNSSRVSDDR